MAITDILIGICVVIVIGLGIYVIIIKLTNRDEEDKDDPLIINFLSHKTGGRFIGFQKGHETGKDGREIIDVAPIDLRLKSIKDLELVEDVKVIVESNKIVNIPKGRTSKDRNIRICLPKSANEFDQSIKETDFGKVLMFLTELKNADATEIEAFREGMRRQSAHIKKIAGGEVSVERMEYISELYDDALEAVIKAQKKGEKTSTYSPIPTREGA